MWDFGMLKMLVTAVVLSVLLQQCSCGTEERASRAVKDITSTLQSSSQAVTLDSGIQATTSESSSQAVTLDSGIQATTSESSSQAVTLDSGTQATTSESSSQVATVADGLGWESEPRGGIKIKIKKPKLKKAKKFLKKYLPFFLIPLIVQAKLIPLFLFKLMLIALKALGVGKLALIIIVINLVYTAMHGAHSADQQYTKEVLATQHYGYNGGPEYGAWLNNRRYMEDPQKM